MTTCECCEIPASVPGPRPHVPAGGRGATAAAFARHMLGHREGRLAAAGAALLAVGHVAGAVLSAADGGGAAAGARLTEAMTLAALAVAGLPVAASGLRALARGRVTINLLMSIAAVGAVAIGEAFEGASVMLLFAVAEALEAFAVHRARDSVRGLVDLAPPTAVRLRDGREDSVPVSDLAVGDTVVVTPGARVPMDGTVLHGASSVDQAPITGESVPVPKAVGDEVFAGSINGGGALTVRVTHRAEDNTLSRLIRLVAEAQSVRAPTQRAVDRFAAWYTPLVVATAVLVAAGPPLVLGAPFWTAPDGTQGWLYRALQLLVIACPCALVIGAPVTVLSALTGAARHGVLIKGGAFLEAMGTVGAVAFDKTGTLTEGRPVVTSIRTTACADGDTCVIDAATPPGGPACDACDDVLALAAALERRSGHPLAAAVVAAADARGVAARYAAADDLKVIHGRGIAGRVDGRLATLGSHALFDAEHPHDAALCAQARDEEAAGRSVMLVCDGDAVRGYLTLADRVRDDSRAVVAGLDGLGLTTVMLTGDHDAVARRVGAAVGVDDVRAGLLPDEKLTAVRQIEAELGPVAMVGDGINDAPALAAATVGIAMGGAGSAQAVETADVVLMADNIARLPYTVRLARLARRIIVQNVAFSLATKLVFVALALAGAASLWLAILADMGVSLLVIANGMRPLRLRDEAGATPAA